MGAFGMKQSKQNVLCCLLLFCMALPLLSQESHRNEPVTGVLLARSAFAHGYRHGYEAGYHQGNIDINMARQARTRFSELRGLPLGYQNDFGPRNSFLYGFQFGLMAGYGDGYSGKEFRAVSNLRVAAAELNPTLPELKVRTSTFDRGNGGETPDYCDGYRRGLILGRTDAFAARGEHGLLEASK